MATENATNPSVFTREGHIRQHTEVFFLGDGKVQNAIYEDGVLTGYRVRCEGGFWAVVPAEVVSHRIHRG